MKSGQLVRMRRRRSESLGPEPVLPTSRFCTGRFGDLSEKVARRCI